MMCSICGQRDHVATSGSSGSKLVQYFTCNKFTEMTPAQSIAAVKGKNLCYQWLFPGTIIFTGKHKDGKCQRDFICKHESHDKYKRKKHVLLCENTKILKKTSKYSKIILADVSEKRSSLTYKLTYRNKAFMQDTRIRQIVQFAALMWIKLEQRKLFINFKQLSLMENVRQYFMTHTTFNN